jgi:cytolysin-activating lysine-acyltransferase
MADGANGQAAAAPQKTVSQVLGEITWLLTQSPLHKQLFIGDLEWFAMPAILLEQFRIWNGPNSPAAVAFWALVSDETQERLEGGAHKLRPDEWNGGQNLWLIELVAPFGATEEILADLSANVFAGAPFRFHTVSPDGQRQVSVYPPPADDVAAGT